MCKFLYVFKIQYYYYFILLINTILYSILSVKRGKRRLESIFLLLCRFVQTKIKIYFAIIPFFTQHCFEKYSAGVTNFETEYFKTQFCQKRFPYSLEHNLQFYTHLNFHCSNIFTAHIVFVRSFYQSIIDIKHVDISRSLNENILSYNVQKRE